MNINLIQCSDDGWAPWSIVCKHLMEGTSREWMAIPSNNPEVISDWLCPVCLKEHRAGRDDIKTLRAICIHCVIKLRKKFDPKFKNDLTSNEIKS